jgi:hypothetical protein
MEPQLMITRLLQMAGLVSPRGTPSAALAAAQRACAERELPWEEPVKVKLTKKGYRIWTKASSIGGNVIILVSEENGEVRDIVTTPK